MIYALLIRGLPFEQLTITCICAADLVLTPVCLNKFCRDNLSVVDEKINGLRYIYPVQDGELMEPVCSPAWKVFATMVNSNRRAQREIYEDLVGRHDYPFTYNMCKCFVSSR